MMAWANRIPRRLAAPLLAIWPAADVTITGLRLAESYDRSDIWSVVVSVFLAPTAFWAGALLLAWTAPRIFSPPRSRLLSRALDTVGLLLLTLMLAYFLALWGYVITNRRMPNPEAVIFLLDNAARVPQHLLQTAPILTLALACAALLIAAIAWVAIRALTPVTIVERPCRVALAGGLCLIFSFVALPTGLGSSPAAFAMSAAPTQRIDARARTYIQSIAPSASAMSESVDRRYPVIVILVESLRHDLLTNYPEAIPFLKSMHDKYISFDYAYATASHSNLTDLAFWYGQYPLRGPGFETYPVDAAWRGTSMFKAFHDVGYSTAYISSQNELWGNMQNWLRTPDVDYYFHSEDFKGQTWENKDDVNGLVRLIEQGLATAGKVEDSETIATALRWIGKRPASEGFFLGMNLQNTHFSYVMPPSAIEPYQPADIGIRAVYYYWPKDRAPQVRNRYLNSVRNVDRLLAGFVEELKRRNLWEECLFVVLGDNGEAFHEHGFGNHSGPMYDEVGRTLAIVKPPGSKSPRSIRVTQPVSHIDIAASVPALAGVRVPESFQGSPAHESKAVDAPVFMYSNAIVRQYAVIEWPWKLMLTELPEMRSELYRLDSDAEERRNLYLEESGKANALKERLESWMAIQRAYYALGAYVDKAPPRYFGTLNRMTSGLADGKTVMVKGK